MTNIINNDVETKIVDSDERDERVESDVPKRLMDDLIKQSAHKPEVGAIIEGTVIGREGKALYVDVPPFGTGIIFGREYLNAKDIIKKVNIGDTVTAKVVEVEGEENYIELSLKEAKQAIVWNNAEKATKNKTQFDILVKDANKGGLILDWNGMDGFLPASQLKPEHYPRVEGGDKDTIADELKKLIGQTLTVSIIGTDPNEGKLIFSEKGPDNKQKREIIGRYTLGDIVEGEVTGAVDFGIFIKIEDGLEGLVHISELDWSLVENPRDLFRVGDKVKAKIIDIKDEKISLSIKALRGNPWKEAEGKYKRGQVVSGVVIKYNKHGALVSLEEGVAGLVHISEFKSEDELRQKLELGKNYTFTINIFEPKDQRMTLFFGDCPDRVKAEENKKKEG
ncbi:MAG TPA: S1 RNA-binding domain-containing protein [Candidatus Paceibacterota bacterium]|nr:S1 RNA-binding domain-containing protein [Candidatus Paceibacterota bacterium]